MHCCICSKVCGHTTPPTYCSTHTYNTAFPNITYNAYGKWQDEKKLREEIAAQIQYEMMPLCVCEKCGNLQEGAIVQRAIDLVLRGV